ncbi:MAG: hypothetical protein NZ874_01520 [Fimbriimonadales bacterium]|nr:hypothetical protein [Fimbriimonadales bacterium]
MKHKWLGLGFLLCCTAILSGQELYDTPQQVTPLRLMKVRWENQRVVPLSDWIEVGEFAPAGGCASGEQVVFSHTEPRSIAVGSNNPYWVNDIATLVSPRYNGARASSFDHRWFWSPPSGFERCFLLLFTVEQVDAECQNVHGTSALDAVLFDFGTIRQGLYETGYCLAIVGGLQLPALPADDGAPGTVLLGGYGVFYARAVDLNTGILTPASGAQPVLAYTGVGTSTALHWSDDNPPDGGHSPEECYQYVDEGARVYGGSIVFRAVLPCSPDLNNDGCIDDNDLLTVLLNFGSTGNAGDTNCDGVVNDQDLLSVLLNFGTGC